VSQNSISLEPEKQPMKDIPVYDYIGEHNIDTDWGIDECVDTLIYDFERGY